MQVPMKRGTARRLGLDLPPDAVTYRVEPTVERFMEGLAELGRRMQLAADLRWCGPVIGRREG